MRQYKSIDEYIAIFDPGIQALLRQVREVIRSEASEATETISYGMPTFKLNGKNLVHFAAFKSHLGFFPTPSGVQKFAKELKAYKTSKGTIQFPLGKPLPLELIREITKFRIDEVMGV